MNYFEEHDYVVTLSGLLLSVYTVHEFKYYFQYAIFFEVLSRASARQLTQKRSESTLI